MADVFNKEDLLKAFKELDKVPLRIGPCVTAEEEVPGVVVLRTESGHVALMMPTKDYEAALAWGKMKKTPNFVVGTLWEKTRLANSLIAELLSSCPDDLLPPVRERLHVATQVLQELEYALRQYREEDGK